MVRLKALRTGTRGRWKEARACRWRCLKNKSSRLRLMLNGIYTHYQYVTSTLPVHYQHTTSTLPVHYQHIAGTLPVHYQHIASTLPVHYQYTASTAVQYSAVQYSCRYSMVQSGTVQYSAVPYKGRCINMKGINAKGVNSKGGPNTADWSDLIGSSHNLTQLLRNGTWSTSTPHVMLSAFGKTTRAVGTTVRLRL